MTTHTAPHPPVAAPGRPDTPAPTHRTPTPWSPQRLARMAGALYLTIFVAGLYAEIGVRTRLIDWDDPAATLADVQGDLWLYRSSFFADLIMIVADVALAVVLYRLFVGVSRTGSAIAAGFRLAQAAVLAANLISVALVIQVVSGSIDGDAATVMQLLTAHRFGYLIGLVLFAAHLAVLGWLIGHSRLLPRWLVPLLFTAASAYVTDTAMFVLIDGYDAAWSPLVLFPAVVAEGATLLWLLIKGVDTDAQEAIR